MTCRSRFCAERLISIESFRRRLVWREKQLILSIETVDVAVGRTAEDLKRSGIQFPLEFVERTALEVRIERRTDLSKLQI